MLLTSRKLLLTKWLDIENDLRGTLRNFSRREFANWLMVIRWSRRSPVQCWRHSGSRPPFTILDKIDRRGAGRPGVILHRMWVDGTEFRWDKEPVVA